jgi:hypothetical protein
MALKTNVFGLVLLAELESAELVLTTAATVLRPKGEALEIEVTNSRVSATNERSS